MEACPTLESILPQISNHETVVLGRGAQGVVYKIGDFVLKTVRFKQTTSNITERDKLIFRNEAEIQRKLSGNPKLKRFVPQFCWYSYSNESGYLLQRYEPVRTLHNLIVNTPQSTLPFAVGHEIYMNLRKAVFALVKEGFYHRDIKPENILIRTSSEEAMKVPILVDFGLACPYKEMAGLLTCEQSIKGGTPLYMVPNMLPRQVLKKQKPITIRGENRYVRTTVPEYWVDFLTEMYALAQTFKEFYPIIDFTGHDEERAEMLQYIQGIEQKTKNVTFQKVKQALKPIPNRPYGGTRKKRAQKKRRPSRKS
jgi:serine/threonine protein kinase